MSSASQNAPLIPATRTATATKKLVEKRNDRFVKAVDEYVGRRSQCSIALRTVEQIISSDACRR